MSRDDILQSVQGMLDSIGSVTHEELVREDLEGQGFQEHADTFSLIIIVTGQFRRADLKMLPELLLLDLHGLLEATDKVFTRVMKLRSHLTGWESERRSLRDELQGLRETFLNRATPFLAFVSIPRLWELEDHVARTLDKFTATSGDFLQKAQQTAEDAERVLGAARDRLVERSVADHAFHFGEEASKHRHRAGWALLTSILLGAGALGYGVWALNNPVPIDLSGLTPGAVTAALVQLTVAKLIILSVIVTATLATLRIYRAHRHNGVVNQHRSNALSAYEAFVTAGKGDPAVRSVILVQVTKAIFAAQPTGFLSHEPDPVPGSQVVEMYRGLRDGTQGG